MFITPILVIGICARSCPHDTPDVQTLNSQCLQTTVVPVVDGIVPILVVILVTGFIGTDHDRQERQHHHHCHNPYRDDQDATVHTDVTSPPPLP